MPICNDDFTLVLYLWHCIQLLLTGTDPWEIIATLYELALDCGRTMQP